MAEVKPLKLSDVGGGVGELREFAVGDSIPPANLPANLASLSGLTGAADRLPYFTGAGALSLATLTGLARNLLDDDTQSGMQSTLDLVKQTSATDTTAGSLLTVGAFGLGITNNNQDPPGGATTNLDTIRTNGIYRITANSPNTPLGSSIGQMIHMGQVGGYAAQLAMKSQTTGKNAPFYRVIDVDVAQPWTMLYTQATTLGTVSQTGGVPTGALIERGSNANGEYVRFADGTLICSRIYSGALSSGLAYDVAGIYRYEFSWTFPSGFYGEPSGVVGSGADAAKNGWMGGGTNASSSSVILQYYTANSNVTSTAIRVIAIGRWF